MAFAEKIFDFTIQTCRICLENHEENHSLFDIAEFEEKICLTDILTRLTNVKILYTEEAAPKRICNDCTESMLSAYQFVCRVEKSETILRERTFREEKQIESLEYFYESTDNQEIEVLDEDLQDFIDDEDICQYEAHESESKIDIYKSCSSESLNEKGTDDAKDTETEEKCTTKTTLDHYKDVQISMPKTESSKLRQSVQKVSSKHILESSSWHKCDQCQRDFARLETLNRHIKIAHTYAPPEEIAAVVALIPNPAKEYFSCIHCPRTFARNDNLVRHVSIVHLKQDPEKLTEKKRYNYKRGLCPYCGQSFSQASLVVHIRRHTGETPYKCEDCNKGFPRRQDLTIHQRKHTGERPHVCSVCGKTFARPNKLTRHMRIHTGERPYKCTECDRSFSQSNDLRIHIRRHTGEKPYKCNICGEAFISGNLLKSHRKLKEHEFEESEVPSDPYEKVRVKNRFMGASKINDSESNKLSNQFIKYK